MHSKKYVWQWLGLGLLAGLVGSCLEPYNPPEITSAGSYLVVDGVLNANGTTRLKLSRTQDLTNPEAPLAELGAAVSVEGENGSVYTLIEADTGTYTLSGASLPPNENYRLRIRTSGGKQYLSDFVPMKPTPAMDSVNWQITGDGVQIYVNTQDPTGSTLYYRWEYDETWEFTTPYQALYIYRAGEKDIIQEDIRRCWANRSSTNIILGSTTRLSQDVIYQYPLILLPPTSEKHRIKYSVQVRQYALTEDEFGYWETLRKNTENIGTLFDPQPSQLISNIHCVDDPAEPVLGYFGACTVQERRIFIDEAELPDDWRRITGYESCQVDTLEIGRVSISPTAVFPVISEVYGGGGQLIAYLSSATRCLDCRTAGTNVRPDFWQ